MEGGTVMREEGDTFARQVVENDRQPVDELALDRERRHAARRFFRAAPPYCIEFDADGMAMLCEKLYEYWPNLEPEEATTGRVISRHADLEEAERRMRLIIGGPVYYDADGRVVNKAPRRRPRWGMPPTDDE
jgi:PAS domain-containing protein